METFKAVIYFIPIQSTQNKSGVYNTKYVQINQSGDVDWNAFKFKKLIFMHIGNEIVNTM